MKRIGNLFSQIVDMDNLYLAHHNAKKGKAWYKEVRQVDVDVSSKLVSLQELLKNGEYKTSKYEIFTRQCGQKARVIYKLPYYPDRIVHHAILQVILPIMVKNLIADTYACVPGRGIHKCANKIKNVLRKHDDIKYCLKMDIRKFYPSIDHEIMKAKTSRLIKCKDTLGLLAEVIDSADTGMPIGNYLSQHLANLYLSGFDHWVKEDKRIKYYFRYSDDIVILGKSKGQLHELRKEIECYLQSELKLSVEGKWQVFPIAARGIDFLGYRFYPGYTLLRKSIAKRFKRRMKSITAGKLTRKGNVSSIASYYGWMCHANTLNLRRKHITSKVINIVERSCEELGCKSPIRKMVV